MANRTRVDVKLENALQGHKVVKGQMSAFLGQKSYAGQETLLFMQSIAIQASCFSIYQTSW